MNTLFSIDGPLYKFFTLTYSLLVLNFLWVIFSLPIVTIGASTTALFYVCGKYVRKEDQCIFKDFIESYKKNFKQSTIIWIILLSILGILALNIRNMYFFGIYSKYLFVIYLCLLIELIIIIIYIFPIISRFNTTIKEHFWNAFLISINYLPKTVIVIIILIAILVLTHIIGFYVLISISSYALITSYIFQNIFKDILYKRKRDCVLERL